MLRPALARWALAIALVAVTTWVNFGIQSLTGGRVPFLPYFPALVAIALLAGEGPALLAIVLSCALVSVFWMSPAGALGAAGADAWAVAFFAAAALAMVGVAWRARRMQRRMARVRDELDRTRLRLEAAHEATRMVEWEWDLGTGRLRQSPSARHVYGAAFDHVEGALGAAHPDDRALVRAEIEGALARGGSYGFTSRMIHPVTGELRWLETRGVVHRGADGAATHVTGITLDVTERQRALEAARQAEQWFRQSLGGGSIIAWACDEDRRYTWVYNPEAGFHPQDFIGKEIGTLLPRDTYNEYRAALDRVWATGRRERLPVTWTREGVTRHYISTIGAVRDEAGRITGMVGASVDVTDIRRAEAALRDGEERLRLAVEGGRIGMWSADHRTGLTHASPLNLELFGLPPDSPPLPHEAWTALVHPDDRAVVDAAWATAQAQDVPYEAEYRIVRPDGAVRWIYSRARIHRNGDGRVERAVGISMDLTARREAEAALREEDRRKDEFLATLAHELRNPLAPLRTAAHLLRSPGLPEPARAEAQAMIERQVAHMTRLVDDLLDVSRLRVGRLELRREHASLQAVVGHALEAARDAIEAAPHTLVVHLPDAPVGVHADVVRLAQVVTNLLTNAARYTPPGGTITVTAEAAGPEAIVRVRDTGIGIAPEMLPRVFEMFAQLPEADGARHGGLGIGLALARRLVEMHGGALEASSAGPGCGSEFRVVLPREDAALAAPTTSAAEAPAAVAGQHVLVVDDNEDAALSLAMLLELRGHVVRAVHSGEDALALLDTQPWRVVLLDLGLPVLDGYEVARRIRARYGPEAPRLVALTGWGQDTDRARTAAAGFDGHLLKPADPAVIDRLIAELTGAAGAR